MSSEADASVSVKKVACKPKKQDKIIYDAYFDTIGGPNNTYCARHVDPLPTGKDAMARFLAEGRRLFYTMKTFDKWCLTSLLLDPDDDEFEEFSYEIPEADKKYLDDEMMETFRVREMLEESSVREVKERRKSLIRDIQVILNRIKDRFICKQTSIPPTKLARFVWQHLTLFEKQEKALYSFGKVLNTLTFLHESYDWPTFISRKVQACILDDENVEVPKHNLWLTNKMEMFASTIDEKGASIVKRWKNLDTLFRDKLSSDELLSYDANYLEWDGGNCMPACGYWEPPSQIVRLSEISQNTLRDIGSLEEWPPNITEAIAEEPTTDDDDVFQE